MKKLTSILLASIFISCSTHFEDKTDNDQWMYGTMSAKHVKEDPANRIFALNVESKGLGIGSQISSIKEMSATSIAFLPNDIMVVSYHGRNGKMIGALELFEVSKTGLARGGYGYLSFEARINNITTDGKNRIFAAMDTRNGPVLTVIEMANGVFMVKETIEYIKLPGESANGLRYVQGKDGNDYLFSATGGDGSYENQSTQEELQVYNFNGQSKISLQEYRQKPGFQKLKVEGQTIIPLTMQGNTNNRGKWIASDGESFATLHFSKYGKSAHATVQFYNNFIEKFVQGYTDFPRIIKLDETTEMHGKNVALMTSSTVPGEKLIYLCLDNKGLQSFSINSTDGTTNHIATFDKKAIAVAQTEDKLLYAACGGQGLYVLRSAAGELTPLKSYKYNGASANFVTTKDDYIFIAYGSEGLVILDKNDSQFSSAE